MQKFILKNKDEAVLEFGVEFGRKISQNSHFFGREVEFCEICEIKILNSQILPFVMRIGEAKNSLKTFIKSRQIPWHREFADEIMGAINAVYESENFMAYVLGGFGLSLNDTFWIVPETDEFAWKDYNIYQNEFNEKLIKTALTGEKCEIKGQVLTPELTTNGALKKAWRKVGGENVLFKGGGWKCANGGREPFAEFYMWQIAHAMGLEAVRYDLSEFQSEILSTCAAFTDKNIGYLPIYYCMNETQRADKIGKIKNITGIYGEENFADLMLFDAIIYNTDRHLGNFGMIIDNTTQNFLRPAPIFDNGFSFLNYLMESELDDIKTAILGCEKSYFNFEFDKQAELFVRPRHKKMLENLADFKFTRHEKFNMDEIWLENGEKFINERSREILKFIR